MTQRSLILGSVIGLLAVGSLITLSVNPSFVASAATSDDCADLTYYAAHQDECDGDTGEEDDDDTPTGVDPVTVTAATYKKAGPLYAVIWNANGQQSEKYRPLRMSQLKSLGKTTLTQGTASGIRKLYAKSIGDDASYKLWGNTAVTANPSRESSNMGVIRFGPSTQSKAVTLYFPPLRTTYKMADWKTLTFRYRAKNENQLKVYYRVSDFYTKLDTAANRKATDKDWVKAKLTYDDKNHVYTVKDIKKHGRYLQLKVVMGSQGNKSLTTFIDQIGMSGQALKKIGGSDGGNGGGDGNGGGSQTKPKATGKLTVMTKQVVYESDEASDESEDQNATGIDATATNTSGGLTVLDETVAENKKNLTPEELCAQSTKEASEVKFTLYEKSPVDKNKRINLEDAVTDEDGMWKYKNDKNEEQLLPIGDYDLTFEPYDEKNQKLVAFCYIKGDKVVPVTGADLEKRKVTVEVTKTIGTAKGTRIVAVYGARNKPQVTVAKHAFLREPKEGEDISKMIEQKIIYPGQRFFYYVSYTNTGGETAKGVVIQDIVPDKLTIADADLQKLLVDTRYSVAPYKRGGTLVKFTVGDLAVGQTGSISIPVTLSASAYADPALGQ